MTVVNDPGDVLRRIAHMIETHPGTAYTINTIFESIGEYIDAYFQRGSHEPLSDRDLFILQQYIRNHITYYIGRAERYENALDTIRKDRQKARAQALRKISSKKATRTPTPRRGPTTLASGRPPLHPQTRNKKR